MIRTLILLPSFLLPPVCTAGETVILYPEDIVDQFTTEFDVFVPPGGTCMMENLLYLWIWRFGIS